MESPPFLVGVCAYDEEDGMRRLLPSLPANCVFAVDGTDGTRALLRRRKVLYSRERRGKSAAATAILDYARAKRARCVVFVQADDVAGPESMRRLASRFSDPAVGMACARTIPRAPRGFIGFCSRLNWGIHDMFGEAGSPKAGEMFAVRMASLERGPPPETINDDAWIQSESERAGYRTVYEPRSQVKSPSHAPRPLRTSSSRGAG